MMPSTPRRDSHRRRYRRGFTLTEMLVVIGIVILVLSIATPMVTRAWRAGDRTRTAADLQAIAGALEAYRQDHGSYPLVAPAPGTVPKDFNGARMLCRALIGPGPEINTDKVEAIADGKGADGLPTGTGKVDPTQPGPGFRTRGRSGPVYGPYLRPDQFKLANPTNPAEDVKGMQPGFFALLDRYNRPILYYPAVGKPNIRLKTSYAWDRTGTDKPMYNALDNWDVTGANQHPWAMPKETLARMLGDIDADGQIEDGETPAYEGPYLLWSAGPDELFGPAPGILPATSPQPDDIRRAVEKSDDVTNFRE